MRTQVARLESLLKRTLFPRFYSPTVKQQGKHLVTLSLMAIEIVLNERRMLWITPRLSSFFFSVC